MKVPIVAYGSQILRKVCEDIKKDQMDVKKLSQDMFDTMYGASGVGLAAPQIGLNLRIFIVDGEPLNNSSDDEKEVDDSLVGFKKTFINPRIIEESGEKWGFEEGCLSIPGVRGLVMRHSTLKITYFDIDWQEHTEVYSGLAARIIQHEYDHLEGVLFTDHLAPLKKQVIKKKLTQIQKGDVDADYKMSFLG
ncbi:MAG: peptide deformylase [Leadbetterella sp.]